MAMICATAVDLPPMDALAEVYVSRPAARGGPVAAMFGPFGDCAFVLLRQGGYGESECWIQSETGRISFADVIAADRAGLIQRAT
ncbi:hypothetical protein [Sphingomonas sp. M1-B02]|uniref:hypothetical protein n=1 Tax=Sphingomonas sp. M1-B02 TaxID=3114300 RepID=UPI0022407929|nr:hypothetical protein [Sphingomonas sp. S6-11]UZK67267.1 hypothetical protein OKW87_05390 [Sphingomonas sp. S6-11]